MVLDASAHHSTQIISNGIFPVMRKSEKHALPTLLKKFIESQKDIAKYGAQPVIVDGYSLTIAEVVATARHSATVKLQDTQEAKERVKKSRQVVIDKVDSGASVYGLTTGFGGSADARTDKPVALGHALLQHLHIGILPLVDHSQGNLSLQNVNLSTTMPESWVRAAILVRMNSLVRGHSGVRWELIEKMGEVLNANLTPVVPLRGTISASGDLAPLSYIAGALIGAAGIELYHGAATSGSREKGPSADVLSEHSISPISLLSKEHLGLVNGTAVSASVAALAVDDAAHLAILAQICTAMGTEALNGTRESFTPFIHAVARPHPGQVECAQNIYDLLADSQLARLDNAEVGLAEDRYSLRQDRYPLRTAPQFLGPQIEDILSALEAVTKECNSTTDNPLIESKTGKIHHGGNFQAMAVTNAMEKTRIALHHIGKILFAQSTELCNPAMNNGLPPSLAATDPSLNYHGKGVDTATAAYAAELGFLASPVSTHIQSAEMHNQAVNSLALISARATLTSLEVLSMLMASYLYLLCQAIDLRALHIEFNSGLEDIVREELVSSLGYAIPSSSQGRFVAAILRVMFETFDKTTVMDCVDQMQAMTASAVPKLLDLLNEICTFDNPLPPMGCLNQFRSRVTTRAIKLQENLRVEFLTGLRGHIPAYSKLGKTRLVYKFIREDLGVKMHGHENLSRFHCAGNDGVIGYNISKIYQAICNGRMRSIVCASFD